MAPRRPAKTARQEAAPAWAGRKCGECRQVRICHKFHTLSVFHKPTLGRCPLVANRCVLLSGDACKDFKPKTICN